MTTNILDPAAIISALTKVLPPSKPRLESQHDAIAALVHTAFTILGFRLIAVDEVGPARSLLNSVLPDEWNQHGPNNYTFRYRHEQSSLEFIVKVIKLGSRTLINSIAVESDKAAALDISTNDFTSTSFFPHDLSALDAQPLVHGYISSTRVADFLSQLKLTTVQKLMPGLRKEGYTEEAGTASGSAAGANAPRTDYPAPARPSPQSPPTAPERFQPPYSSPAQGIPAIGRRDLDPIPRNPFSPPSLFPDHGNDGMFVGPEHPIFGTGMRGQGGRGPWGGDGFLPPLGAPPGARFDPVGPHSPFGMPGRVPFSPPGRFPGGGPRGPSLGFPDGTQEPDNDEYMPPGMDDMFS